MPKHYTIPVQIVQGVAALLILSVALSSFNVYYSLRAMIQGSSPLSVLKPRRVAHTLIDVTNRYGLDADNDWASVTPHGHGFVRLEDGNYYVISLYHQIHCLNSFRRSLRAARDNVTSSAHDGAHALHCLSYMRQLVLCNADVALEPARLGRTASGQLTQAAYGTDVEHVCRDWEQVRAFAEENYEKWKGQDVFVASEPSAVEA